MPVRSEPLTEELIGNHETVESIAPHESISVAEESRVAGILLETRDPMETWSAHRQDYYKAVRTVYGCLNGVSEGLEVVFDKDALVALGHVLIAWKFASAKADEQYHKHPSDRDFEADAFWDGAASRVVDDLGAIFDPDMSNIAKRLTLSDWETPKRMDIAEQLLINPDFEQKGILTEYMAYKVWFNFCGCSATKPIRLADNSVAGVLEGRV